MTRRIARHKACQNSPRRGHNLYLLTRRLRRHGFEVMVAADGAPSVRAVERERPDLVLTDLSLPQLGRNPAGGWSLDRPSRA